MAYRLGEEWASIQVVWLPRPQALSLSPPPTHVPPCLLEQLGSPVRKKQSIQRSHLISGQHLQISTCWFLSKALWSPCAAFLYSNCSQSRVSTTCKHSAPHLRSYLVVWPDWFLPLLCFFPFGVDFSHLSPLVGSARGIQNQHQPGERLPEEELARQCEVASLRLPVLLLHSRVQSVARYLPQQEGTYQGVPCNCPLRHLWLLRGLE